MKLNYFKKLAALIFFGLLCLPALAGRKLIIERSSGFEPDDIQLILVGENGKRIGKIDLCSLGKIGRLHVEKKWRGKGYGAFLFRVAIETLTALQCEMPITWEAAAFDNGDQKRLVAFYQHLGGKIDHSNEKGFPEFEYRPEMVKPATGLGAFLKRGYGCEFDLDKAKDTPVDNQRVLKVLDDPALNTREEMSRPLVVSWRVNYIDELRLKRPSVRRYGSKTTAVEKFAQEHIAPFYVQHLPDVRQAKKQQGARSRNLLLRYLRACPDF